MLIRKIPTSTPAGISQPHRRAANSDLAATPLNIRAIAVLASADQELAAVERYLKQSGDRRQACKIAEVRAMLARAVCEETSDLEALVGRFQEEDEARAAAKPA